ncbi:MAG: hypothetical protein AAGC56_08860 [Pseudomonadota bacterium]
MNARAKLFAAVACAAMVIGGCAGGAARGRAPSDAGVAAYRAGDFETAWTELKPLSERGVFRAQRYVAFMLMSGRAPAPCDGALCVEEAKALLIDSAGRGDTNSLIALEAMRASGEAFAPSDADMDALDRVRAAGGDPMSAWRLEDRGVEPVDAAERIAWLRTAAAGDPRIHRNAPTAAFRLCTLYAAGEGVEADRRSARKWCKRAAKAGHTGAYLALTQLDGRGADE